MGPGRSPPAATRPRPSGRLDVVNNAGYGRFGMVEEITEQQLRDQLETNLFGALSVTRAALPILREQGSGHIIQISIIGGIGAFPSLGGYHSSKWALGGLTESLAQELAGTGVRVTLVEPGGFAADWSGSSGPRRPEPRLRPHPPGHGQRASGSQPGDPTAAGPALLEVVDAEQLPLRVLFGSQPTELVKHIYAQRLQTWADGEHVSHAAQG